MRIIKPGILVLVAISAVIVANAAIWADAESHRVANDLARQVVVTKELTYDNAAIIAIVSGKLIGYTVLFKSVPAIAIMCIGPFLLVKLQDRLDMRPIKNGGMS